MKDKVIVITGGSKGLGLDINGKCLARGATVFIISRSEGALPELRKKYPEHLHWLQADLSDPQAIKSAFSKIKIKSDHIDSLILNAALTVPKPFLETSLEDIQQNLMINIAGSLICLQQATPMLRGGKAVFISSESVTDPFPFLSIYAGCKAAVETIFTGLRAELLKQHEVQLSVIRAGFMADTSFAESWSPEEAQQFMSAAAEIGNLSKSGAAMPVDRVSATVLYLLNLPQDANIQLIEVRSGEAS